MKKSNWLAYTVAVIIAAFLLGLWFYLGFDHIDAPLDLVLTIIWICLILVSGYIIHKVEKKRQMRIRSCYVTKGKIFNSEKGFVDLDGKDPADVVAETIEDLDYGFDTEEMSKDFRADYVIRTEKFKPENDTWTGEVELGRRRSRDIKPTARFKENEPVAFKDEQELRELVAEMESQRG